MLALEELTEQQKMDYAAKAIGEKLLWPSIDDLAPTIESTFQYWKPKDDDGDALRLSARLSIQIEYIGPSTGPVTEVNCYPRGRGDCGAIKPVGNDRTQATRLAIFEAAVLLGMSMKV